MLSLIFVGGCMEGVSISEPPLYTAFNEPFPKRGINLSREMGSDFWIKKNGRTFPFHIEYYRADRTNLITDTEGDTMFNGTISQYRGVYYFNHKLNNGNYQIAAMQLDGDLVKGFLAFHSQMHWLQDSLEKWKDVKPKKDWPGYLLACEDENILIQTEKRAAKMLFEPLLEKMEYDTLIREGFEADQQVSSENKEEEPIPETKNSLIKSISPNPAVDQCIIFLSESEYSVTLTLRNIEGKKLDKVTINDRQYTFDLGPYPSGTYIIQADNGEMNETEQLLIQK